MTSLPVEERRGRAEVEQSLCGDPEDVSRCRIAVLREQESRGGSAWLHESLEVGDAIAVRAA